jgi:hypothetical protein
VVVGAVASWAAGRGVEAGEGKRRGPGRRPDGVVTRTCPGLSSGRWVMDDHLDYLKGGPAGNSRNGSYGKTITTTSGRPGGTFTRTWQRFTGAKVSAGRLELCVRAFAWRAEFRVGLVGLRVDRMLAFY